MQALFGKFGEMKPLHKRLLWGLSVVSVVGVFWLNFYGPLLEKQTELKDDIERLESDQIRLDRVLRSLPVLKTYVQNLQQKLERARQELPDQREIPNLLSSVSDLARDAGLDVQLFKPMDEVFKEFYAEVPVSISVKGTYQQVASFFDEVGRLSRIVTISDVVIKDPTIASTSPYGAARQKPIEEVDETEGGGKQTFTMCTATTFRLLDEAEMLKVKQASEPVQGRRGRG